MWSGSPRHIYSSVVTRHSLEEWAPVVFGILCSALSCGSSGHPSVPRRPGDNSHPTPSGRGEDEAGNVTEPGFADFLTDGLDELEETKVQDKKIPFHFEENCAERNFSLQFFFNFAYVLEKNCSYFPISFFIPLIEFWVLFNSKFKFPA